MSNPDRVVSSESEQLILVNQDDDELGFASKAQCHDGDGVLHRAFSLFLFNDAGELLLQQRAAGKRLWPRYWSNSCCSHPRRGESMRVATERRLDDELNISAELSAVYSFRYQAKFSDLGSENELCHVFLGRIEGSVRPNVSEIEAIRFVTADAISAELQNEPQQFTPWFKQEWQSLNGEYRQELLRYAM